MKRVGFQAGDGRQWASWVGRDEPNPLRNVEFAATTIRALGQKQGGIMPAFFVRRILREMGEEFILASQRVQPTKLLAAVYTFRFPGLEEALCHEKESMNLSLVD